jgi:hypothetical protein
VARVARAEPKMLRYKILHTAARLTHGGRRRQLKIQASWPWAEDIVTAELSQDQQRSELVGMAGFEPAASCSQSRRANQAALHPGRPAVAYPLLATRT